MSKRFCIFQPSLFKYHPEESGSSTAIIEYDDKGNDIHTTIIDTGSKDSDALKAYQSVIKSGVVDAIIFTHPHEDHMGDIERYRKVFKIKSAYLPSKAPFLCHSSLKGRANYIDKIRSQCITECGEENVHYITEGDSFKIGDNIRCDIIFRSNYKQLKEVDPHHYVNNTSLGTLFTLTDIHGRTWTYYGGGDNAKEANDQFIARYGKNPLKPDFVHVQWHGDQDASSLVFCKVMGAKYGLLDYHHNYKSSGRTMVINRFNTAGCRVLGNYLYGNIICDIYDEGYASIYAEKNLTKIKWIKYKAINKQLNLIQTTAYACKVFAGAYGKDPQRSNTLTALFGANNAKAIQNRVNILNKNKTALKYAFAAAIINGYFGSGDARVKALGDYQQMGQGAVEEVNRRKKVSLDVLAKEIGKGAWGDNAGVIRVLTTFKKYEWSKVLEACKKNKVKIKWS